MEQSIQRAFQEIRKGYIWRCLRLFEAIFYGYVGMFGKVFRKFQRVKLLLFDLYKNYKQKAARCSQILLKTTYEQIIYQVRCPRGSCLVSLAFSKGLRSDFARSVAQVCRRCKTSPLSRALESDCAKQIIDVKNNSFSITPQLKKLGSRAYQRGSKRYREVEETYNKMSDKCSARKSSTVRHYDKTNYMTSRVSDSRILKFERKGVLKDLFPLCSETVVLKHMPLAVSSLGSSGRLVAFSSTSWQLSDFMVPTDGQHKFLSGCFSVCGRSIVSCFLNSRAPFH